MLFMPELSHSETLPESASMCTFLFAMDNFADEAEPDVIELP